MIKLVASDLDGTLLLNGAPSGRDFPIDQRTEKAWEYFCGSKVEDSIPTAEGCLIGGGRGGASVRKRESGDVKVSFYQGQLNPELVREILEAIEEKDGAEFSLQPKRLLLYTSKTQHYLDLMTKLVKTTSK